MEHYVRRHSQKFGKEAVAIQESGQEQKSVSVVSNQNKLKV